jgi:aryl-alcohol dehydrogenase
MCHTDLHGRDGYFPNLPYPVLCGNEGAGIIEQVGTDVADFAPGDPSSSRSHGAANAGRVAPSASPIVSVPARSNRAAAAPTARSPLSRNGEPVYSCFVQQSSFASFAVAPAKGRRGGKR